MLLTRSMENNWMSRRHCPKMVQTRGEEGRARAGMITGEIKVFKTKYACDIYSVYVVN